MRAVRLAESALDDIERQLGPERSAQFKQIDLAPALEALSRHDRLWDAVSVAHGPARRVTITSRTVAGYHLFGVDDSLDPRDGAIVIYYIDIWVDEFPD